MFVLEIIIVFKRGFLCTLHYTFSITIHQSMVPFYEHAQVRLFVGVNIVENAATHKINVSMCSYDRIAY